MEPVSLVVVFTIVWWLVFFVLLPLGLNSKVNEAGAPQNPRVWRKALLATAIALTITAFSSVAVSKGWLNLRPLFEPEQETF